MHTEIDAKNLWCPLVQHEGKAGGSFNRGWSPGNPLNKARTKTEDSHLCNCIASRCAAWRWKQRPPAITIPCPDAYAKTEPLRPGDMPPGWVFIPHLPYLGTTAHWSTPENGEPNQGYCGWITPAR